MWTVGFSLGIDLRVSWLLPWGRRVGGVFLRPVCWWHSREVARLELTVYSPSCSKQRLHRIRKLLKPFRSRYFLGHKGPETQSPVPPLYKSRCALLRLTHPLPSRDLSAPPGQVPGLSPETRKWGFCPASAPPLWPRLQTLLWPRKVAPSQRGEKSGPPWCLGAATTTRAQGRVPSWGPLGDPGGKLARPCPPGARGCGGQHGQAQGSIQ